MNEIRLIPLEWGGSAGPVNTLTTNASAHLIESKRRLDHLYQHLLAAGKLDHYSVAFYLDLDPSDLPLPEQTAVGMWMPGLKLKSDGSIKNIYNDGMEHEAAIRHALASPIRDVDLSSRWWDSGRAFCYCCDPDSESLQPEAASFSVVPNEAFDITRIYSGTNRHDTVIEFWTASVADFDSALDFYQFTNESYWEDDWFQPTKPDSSDTLFKASLTAPDWQIAERLDAETQGDRPKESLQTIIRECLDRFAPCFKEIPDFSDPFRIHLDYDFNDYAKMFAWTSANSHWAMRLTVY